MKLAGNFIAVLATATALLAAPAAQAGYPGANGKIAFERTAGSAYRSSAQIFRSSPGGMGEALLAAPRGDLPTAPSFSADGSRLVFERQARIGYGSISIARADGSGERTVPGDGHHPSLSPNGKLLALDSGGSVWTESLSGSRRTRLTTGTDPEWSPDGRRLAFVRDGDIYVISGGAERRLTRDGGNAGPSWSPKGNALAFWHTYTVQTIAIDGTHRRNVASGMQPAWSPDGTKIAYSGEGGIWTVDANGRGAHRIIANAFMPAWQTLPR